MIAFPKTLLVTVLAAALTGALAEASTEPGGPRPQKPLLHGREFEAAEGPNRLAKRDKKDELISPIIVSPMRTLPSVEESEILQKAEKDAEILRQNQNEIFVSIQNFLNEYKSTENVGEKTTNDTKEVSVAPGEIPEEIFDGNHRPENTEEEEHNEYSEPKANSEDRQNSERSIMLVLPFQAKEETVEELFTKKPKVKLIENPEDLLKEAEGMASEKKKGVIFATKTEKSKEKIVPRKGWRPTKWYKTTTESSLMTTETGEVVKTCTNHNDGKVVTKEFEGFTLSTEKHGNHKLAFDVKMPYPLLKVLKNESEVVTQETSLSTPKSDGLLVTTDKSTPKKKSQRRRTTTEDPRKPDLSKVLDILPSDMKDLLLEIGLNKTGEEKKGVESDFRVEKIPQPLIDPKSFSVFKPLPLEERTQGSDSVPDEMKEFLASFGLLTSKRRVQKSLEPSLSETPFTGITNVNLEFLPRDLKVTLENMGLAKTSDTKESIKVHVFNPNNRTTTQSDEDLEKINAILASIKTKSDSLTTERQPLINEKFIDFNNLGNNKTGNISETTDEIQKIATRNSSAIHKHRKRATKSPMFGEEIVVRKVFKRQDDSSSAEGSSSAPGEDTSTTTETAPDIEALKESFGGGETAAEDADIQSSLPPKKPNGLYLLLDWNSFLEVGTSDDNRRVNLRFQPKIGDSRNFLPVSVP